MPPDPSSRPPEAAPSPQDYPPVPAHPLEPERLAAVREVAPLTRTGDPAMVSLAKEAKDACGVMVGMVSLLEEQEEWVVACVGTEAERIPRIVSFCAHTILEPDVLVVEDVTRDPRFDKNPYVLDEHHMRFYAGAPVFDATGLPLGAICVAHAEPMRLDSRCLFSLRRLADAVSAVLEARLLLADAHSRYLGRAEAKTAQARLDLLLQTLVEPRPYAAG